MSDTHDDQKTVLPLGPGAVVAPARVGVLIIHGINTSSTNYSDGFRKKLRKHLLTMGLSEPHDVCFEEVFWGSVTKSGQSEIDISNTVYRQYKVARPIARQFILRALADAAAYQDLDRNNRKTIDAYLSNKRNDGRVGTGITYDRVNEAITRSLAALAARTQANSPLIVAAHSFGGQVAHCYISDIQRGVKTAEGTALQRLDTLAGMITFGCNIPAFCFAADQAENSPIELPGQDLPEFKRALDAAGQKYWLNFYHQHDVLGFPLGTINEQYRNVVEDIPIIPFPFTPPLWDYINPHTDYWTNKKVIETTAQMIYLARRHSEVDYKTKVAEMLAKMAKERDNEQRANA